MKKVPKSAGIVLKKKYGQHFLQDISYIHHMIQRVNIVGKPVFEIGPGQGALTREILKTAVSKLWVFEIDEEWVAYLQKTIQDPRLTIKYTNILDVDYACFVPDQPWTLLANLPYQITFPLLHQLHAVRHLWREGVIMVQEEVAQKIVAKRGRDYGYSSLFFQYFFEWELMDKVPPTAFYPPPKIYSRLLYFKPKVDVPPIKDEAAFWLFVKQCFKQPRRTLKNNLQQTNYATDRISEDLLASRAQQLAMNDLLALWDVLHT